MPANFCLLPKYADELKERFASGALNVDALAALSSADRRAALAEIIGDANAEHVNAAFESKLLLQNQKRGLETWIKQTTEGKPEVQRDLLARVQRMDRVLQPGDPDGFLADLAKQKLGFGVTMEEAGKIAQLAKAASDARTALENGTGDRLAYGRAKVAFSNYVSELKNSAAPARMTVGGALKTVAGLSKSVAVAFNDHALFRQGWSTLWTQPTIWYKNAMQSFVDLAKQYGGHEVLDEVKADIHSRPNALNGRYKKAGLAVGAIEEDFPGATHGMTPVAQKVASAVETSPIGRAYKASEAAFTAFQWRNRADLFDKYAQIAERSGVDLTDRTQLESIGKFVNSLTARGDLGEHEGAANTANVFLFSVRKLKADFDVLSAHQLQGGVTPFVRKQAAINLLKAVGGTAAVMATAKAMGATVETDWRSADFGKIKVGHTRFDITGGKGSLVVLAARLLTMSSKSSVSGKVRPLNSGKFGATTGVDLVTDFLEGRASPAASIAIDVLKGQTRTGEKPTLLNEAKDHLSPITATNADELYNDPNSAGVLAGSIADALGVATSTYDGKKRKKPK